MVFLCNNSKPFRPSHPNSICILSLFILLVFNTSEAKSQTDGFPFADGERLSYRVSYNWEFLWLDAGKVEFNATKEWKKGRQLWHFQSSGQSLKAYDIIYKVRDSFESMADFRTFELQWYHRKTREGSYTANNQLYFYSNEGVIISKTENTRQAISMDTLVFCKDVFDLQTAVYYARTFDFDGMQPGNEIPLKVIVDGEIYDLSGEYLGKENVELRNGRIFECYHFTVELVAGTIFKAGERASIWVSADKNRVPVLIEAQILVGSVKAWLSNADNLQYPQSALIN